MKKEHRTYFILFCNFPLNMVMARPSTLTMADLIIVCLLGFKGTSMAKVNAEPKSVGPKYCTCFKFAAEV